jgi:hypothetical protein
MRYGNARRTKRRADSRLIEFTVGKTTATVALTLKSTAVVADVQTQILTDQSPRDHR